MAEVAAKFEQIKGKLPTLNKVLAIVILVLNIILPGIGTIICSLIGPKFELDNLLVGIVQLLLAVCIIGWVWSIWWGIIVLQKSSG